MTLLYNNNTALQRKKCFFVLSSFISFYFILFYFIFLAPSFLDLD